MHPRWFLVVLLAATVVVAGALIAFDSSPNDLGCSGFSQSDWQEHNGELDGAKALEGCSVLNGKSEAQIRSILGRPQESHQTKGGRELSWGLETDYLGDTTSWLLVTVDDGGRAIDTSVAYRG